MISLLDVISFLFFQLKELDVLKKFILKHRPHVVAVTGQCREAQNVVDDIRFCIVDLEQEQQMSPIYVELIDGEVAKIYEASPRSEVNNIHLCISKFVYLLVYSLFSMIVGRLFS